MRFENKVCLITGGGSGIGKAICIRLASEGGKIAVVDINADHGNETVKQITDSGREAIFAQCDVSQEEQVKNAVKAAVDKWGKLDILVNDAAMMTFKKVVDLPVSDWDKVIAVNLRSMFMFCHYGLPHMKNGAIVNISSVHAFETESGVSPYASSKGGIEAFTRALSLELAEPNVRVNAVAPGSVDTPMLWNNPNVKDGREKVKGAVGKPEDIAAAVAFLASDEAKFITGTTLVVDGGRLDILS
ncbi:MAG: SDR family oxidoreductase [Acidobacteriota bacterium]|nr:SDR family oxidoreductase [Acidobacteriota bacterium]